MKITWAPSDWKIYQVGEVLKKVSRSVAVEANTIYREIGIRSHAKGIFHKKETTGAAIGKKRVFWIEPGCFVVNIVFAWEGAVAQTSNAEQGMIASHRFPMYKPVDKLLDLDFVTYFFQSQRGNHLLRLASPGGAGRNKTLGQQAFSKLEIPLPSIAAQKEIGAILRDSDEAITLTERLIEAKQERKKGLMQQLLTGKVRFPGFEGEWQEGRFIDFMVLQRGFDLRVSERKEGDVKIIASNGCIGYHNESRVKGPGVVTGRSGTIGKVTYENNNFWPLNTSLFVKDFKDNLPLFVFYFLQQFKLERFSTGTGVPTLNRNYVHPTKIYFPEFDEQHKIAAVLQACDEEITLLKRKAAALRQQKKGLMQQLLTGKVRV